MEESPVLNKISQDVRLQITETLIVSYFARNIRLGIRINWTVFNENNCRQNYWYLILVNDIQHKIVRKFTFNERFLVKTATSTKNEEISLNPKAKILNHS